MEGHAKSASDVGDIQEMQGFHGSLDAEQACSGAQGLSGDVLATESHSAVSRCPSLYDSPWRIGKVKRENIFLLLENEFSFKINNYSWLENYTFY